LVGTFLLLRKRSLLSDTVSHCTLPGIALAFRLAEATGISGRSLPLLLAGAAATAVLGMLCVAAIRARTHIKDDAALAIVLSVFFGLGVALIVWVQQVPTGNAAGLKSYIYGKAAAMTAADAQLILLASLGVAGVCGALYKELKVLCFDAAYAQTAGWPIVLLDLALMGLVVAVTVIGLQAVGLLLVVALLIITPAAARFWTHRLGTTVLLATLIGGVSGFVGVIASALFSRLPAGAVIVLAAVLCFTISFVFGTERGWLIRWWQQRRTEQRVARLHLLRAIYERCEAASADPGKSAVALLEQAVSLEGLRAANEWSPQRLRRLVRLGVNQGLITVDDREGVGHLTGFGRLEARRVTRNHRLWETYLLRHADVAPQHIHHNADQIEHVIEPYIVNELEELLAHRGAITVPADPEKPAPTNGRLR
jgi:manganese/zinc/iron transport system permease protein